MIRLPSWNSREAGFEVGGRKMGNMEYLFAGALILVIALALVLAIYSLFRTDDPRADDQTRYSCIAKTADGKVCGNEFTIDPNADPAKGAPPPMPTIGIPMQECPKCHKLGGVQMIHCPNPKCKAYYMPPAGYYSMGAPGMPAARPKAVCPKCNTDRDEYLYAEHKKSQGK